MLSPRTLLLPLLAPLLSSAAPPPQRPGAPPVCVVDRVIDGDTVLCAGGVRVREIGIDAPELSQEPHGRLARDAHLRITPPGARLRIETDVELRDRYGRLLAYLWTQDGRLVAQQLAAEGYALQATIPPNVRHADRIRAAVAAARGGGRGLWRTGGFDCAPRDRRAGRC